MPPVTFGIPLISKRVAKDWPTVERSLANTLRSVLQQQGADINVIVACHEVPEVAQADDPRIGFARVDFDIPRFRWEQEIDRMRKLEHIAASHRARGGGWLFILDADDLVARDFAKRIASSAAKTLIVASGYRFDARSARLQPMKRFWRKCGSSCAVNWQVDELPVVFPEDRPTAFHQFAETRHYSFPSLFQQFGWSMDYIREPSVVYMTNHGQNQSEIISRLPLKWRLYYALTPRSVWTTTESEKFGVDLEQISSGIYTGGKKFSTDRDWMSNEA